MSEEHENARQLFDIVYEAVRRQWDPIGVGDSSGASHEYDAYVPKLVEMVLGRTAEAPFFKHLWQLETEHMGLVGDRKRTHAFAQWLARLAESAR